MKKILKLTTICVAVLGTMMVSCDDDDSGTPCMDKVWYRDLDGDGRGDKLYYLYSCKVQPEGFVSDNSDKDDNNPDI